MNKISSYIISIGAIGVLISSCSKADKSQETVTDIEGNIYQTVTIGTQVWMAENLKTTLYNDKTIIPLVTDSLAWDSLTSPGFCWYGNNKSGNKDTYGALYNGFAVSTGKLCPVGWHIPDKDEWEQLRNFSGDTLTAGGQLKEAGTDHWLKPNIGADNSSGFEALPSGIRYFEGSFSSISYYTAFWSSLETGTDQLWYLSLYHGDATASMNHVSKRYGLSIRCVKD
jgi:uncharacterized protein (TIGR02145 family)